MVISDVSLIFFGARTLPRTDTSVIILSSGEKYPYRLHDLCKAGRVSDEQMSDE